MKLRTQVHHGLDHPRPHPIHLTLKEHWPGRLEVWPQGLTLAETRSFWDVPELTAEPQTEIDTHSFSKHSLATQLEMRAGCPPHLFSGISTWLCHRYTRQRLHTLLLDCPNQLRASDGPSVQARNLQGILGPCPLPASLTSPTCSH